jgi:glutaredoxin 3
VAKLELFGTASCPYTQEMREWLEWKRSEFVEYDVEEDPSARKRLLALVRDQSAVPVLVEDNKVVQVGWHGRACVLGRAKSDLSRHDRKDAAP